MRQDAINPQQIVAIKRQARAMSRQSSSKTYMQCLDIVCRESLGVRHFHEAQKLAKKHVQPPNPQDVTPSPWTLYLQACQDAYVEI